MYIIVSQKYLETILSYRVCKFIKGSVFYHSCIPASNVSIKDALSWVICSSVGGKGTIDPGNKDHDNYTIWLKQFEESWNKITFIQ